MDVEYDGGVCQLCGGAWFELAPYEDDEGELTGVCIDTAGLITGHTGQLKCLDCGVPFPERYTLRLVE